MLSTDTRRMAALGAAGFIATALVLAAASPLHGQPLTVTAHKDTLTARVSYADLSLASKEGRQVLMRRVGYAVNVVCPTLDEDGSYYDQQGCADFAWAGARPQIKRAFDRARSGSTLAMSISISSASGK